MKNHRGLHGERLVDNADPADTYGRSDDEWDPPRPAGRLMGTHPALRERLLTIAEVADFLGVPVGTVYQWRHKRTGPKGIRVGRHVRYRPREVEAWLESLARNAEGPGDRRR